MVKHILVWENRLHA